MGRFVIGKVCVGCGIRKPMAAFVRDRKGGGLRHECRDCRPAGPRGRPIGPVQVSKECAMCGLVKRMAEFGRDRSRGGRYDDCRSCRQRGRAARYRPSKCGDELLARRIERVQSLKRALRGKAIPDAWLDAVLAGDQDPRSAPS